MPSARSRAGDVRFTPESGQTAVGSVCPLSAKSGHNAVQQISAGLSSRYVPRGCGGQSFNNRFALSENTLRSFSGDSFKSRII
jgi:hypothetical protein